MFVHHVLFWLKEDLSETQKQTFVTHLHAMKEVDTLRLFSIGTPASTNRPVIDRTYSYSLLTVFEDLAGHDVYQAHPLHKAFLENCRDFWSKIVIYDAA